MLITSQLALCSLFNIILADFSYFENKNHYPNITFLNAAPKEVDVISYEPSVKSKLEINYGVGSKMVDFKEPKDCPHPVDSERWYNSFAVASSPSADQLHGKVGYYNNIPIFTPNPTPVKIEDHPGGEEAALKVGGFYQALSDSLPLHRVLPDLRPEACKAEKYYYPELTPASVIITFYNEPFSTLMRTVVSVLDNTPPELLTEIILVDDGSNFQIGPNTHLSGTENFDYEVRLREFIRYLPKVKYMKLPQRSGIVKARLAGIKAALADVIVILDSHVEVNKMWLEPQLKVLHDNPKSLVVPQIFSINPRTFEPTSKSGIGCNVSFRWNMIESSTFDTNYKSANPVISPNIAGGLFAVRKDVFWDMGAFDEQFTMWGSENVEIGFRYWLCGAQILCAPCAVTYHVFRENGHGYISPPHGLVRNKIRTAKTWLDEYYPLAEKFIGNNPEKVDIGTFDEVEQFKKRKNCKPFKWFLNNVARSNELNESLRNDPTYQITANDILYSGYLRAAETETCADVYKSPKTGNPLKTYGCHYSGGVQAFVFIKHGKGFYIVNALNSTQFLNSEAKFVLSRDVIKKKGENAALWRLTADDKLLNIATNKCLSLPDEILDVNLVMKDCDKATQWEFADPRPDKTKLK